MKVTQDGFQDLDALATELLDQGPIAMSLEEASGCVPPWWISWSEARCTLAAGR
jgi:hypothetical protein